MNSPFKLTGQHAEALNALSESDLPQDVIDDTLEGLTGEIEAKCESVAMWRENQLVIAEAKKQRAKKLNDEAKAIENAANKMIDYLDENMSKVGIESIECDYFTIRYQKNPPSVEIEDLNKIPISYIKSKTTESADKAAIKKALQNGAVIEGAKLIDSRRLLIK